MYTYMDIYIYVYVYIYIYIYRCCLYVSVVSLIVLVLSCLFVCEPYPKRNATETQIRSARSTIHVGRSNLRCESC